MRRAVYERFIACGGPEKLAGVKTSCAVFAGAVLHWAGRAAKLPRYRAPTSISSWLAGLTSASSSWRVYGAPNCVPESGAIFYVESDANPLNNHVGVLCYEVAPDVWLTAEGGKGDGTECSVGLRRWGSSWDARRLRGLWLPEFLDRVEAPPPAPDAAAASVSTFPVGPYSSEADVFAWQERLLAWMPGCLPRFGADADWGNETAAATKLTQRAHALPETGTCDVATWKATVP